MSERIRAMSAHTCRSEVGTSVPRDSDTFRRDHSNLDETAKSRGKGFCNSSSMIGRCWCTGDEGCGRWVIGVLKYASNSSSGIKTGEEGGVTLWCHELLVPWVSIAGLLDWEVSESSGMSTSIEGLVDTLAAWKGYWTAETVTTGSFSSNCSWS